MLNWVLVCAYSHPPHLSLLLSFSLSVESHPPILLPEVMVSHPKSKSWHIPAHRLGAASNPLYTHTLWLSTVFVHNTCQAPTGEVLEKTFLCRNVPYPLWRTPSSHVQIYSACIWCCATCNHPPAHPLSESKPAIVPLSGMEHKMYLIIVLHHEPTQHTSEFTFK